MKYLISIAALLAILVILVAYFVIPEVTGPLAFIGIVAIAHSAGWSLQALVRSHHCLGALTLVNLTGFQRGIESDETGINVSRFSVEVEPEINEWLPGKDGQARGKAVGDPMGKLTIEGEVSGANGVMAAVFTTAFVPTNDVTYFGRSAGGFYLDRGTVDQERDGWRKVSTEFSSRFNVA